MIDCRRLACLCLLAGFLVTSPLQILANDEDLLNERFFEPGRAIEVHWRIDCAKTSKEVLALLVRFAEPKQADCDAISVIVHQDELNDVLDSLKKCGFIYNTKGNRRFQPCPDYALAYRGLSTATDTLRCARTKPASRLELLRNTRAALLCGKVL